MAAETSSSAMMVKFETRSNRVKGLSFHPKRPWILASLHNGAIQLWDYRMGSLIDRFEEHDGPVRGVDFHSNQPLFVSGGDDFKIKLWNYKLRRCLFTLTGHSDYVRTVQFHTKLPWVVSASDDMTLRIWNWQGRSCMSVLTGHNHYVMSASFHPRRDLVVSASLDQTLRLWDVYQLKSQSRNQTFAGNMTQDFFGGSDVQLKFMLDGHERGVNYAAFHPTLPFIVSGADDRTIKIWRVEETRAYEIEHLRGHTSNVSCVMYFKDYVVSNSEDRSIRVWDVKTRSPIYASRRENDRFWVLAVHTGRNLIAAGHDQGMIVFKLERERPAMQIVDNTLYWVRQNLGDRQLRAYDFETKTETSVLTLNRRQIYPPHTLSFCKEENMVVFYYGMDGGTFELYPVGKSNVSNEDVRRGFYTSAVFFKRNKFAVLDKGRQIIIKNTQNNILSVLPPVHNTNQIFWAPNNMLLLRSDDKVYMFDPHLKNVTAQATAAKVKYVVWSPDKGNTKVALLSKHTIGVFSKKGLKNVCSLHEGSRIKSACFDEKAIVLLYTTLNHLKYCLPNGDTGTIGTLEAPIYLVSVSGDEVSYINREGTFLTMNIDTTEYRLKLALLNERWNEVLKIVKSTRIYGQALVSYLQQRGFPEVAMHFVKDPKIRFKLAVDCGNLDDALECAEQLKDDASWNKLAQAALSHGKVQLMHTSLSKTSTANAYQKLSFLNFLLGNDEKARDFADMQRDDVNQRFQTALFTGDAELRVKLLEEAGQYTLAHQVAVRHGMKEKANSLLRAAGQALQESMTLPPPEDEEEEETEDIQTTRSRMELKAKEKAFEVTNRMVETTGAALTLPKKRTIANDWPMTRIDESPVMVALRKGITDSPTAEPFSGGGDGDWAGDIDSLGGGSAGKGEWGAGGGAIPSDDLGSDLEGEDNWGIDDAVIGVEAEDIMASGKGDKLPNSGRSIPKLWCENSKHAVDHIAAGNFESGMKLLKAQYGIKDFSPLKETFLLCYATATGSATMPGLLPAQMVYQNRSTDKLPLGAVTMAALNEKAKVGGKFTTEGKFGDACKAFRSVLQLSIFLVCSDEQAAEKAALLKKARNYATACSLQMARGGVPDAVKSSEMAAYFTHFEMEPKHMALVLKFAMVELWKRQFIRTSGLIAKRLLDFNPEAKLLAQAKKVVQTAEVKDDISPLNYDARNPFEVCVKSWTPMYAGTTAPIRCSCCHAPSQPQYSGEVCPICEIGELGREASGPPKTQAW
eukprot:TRINITY_DN42020_c0_g1_i1.p1 TRINITY_DN42020_c0_g1~~TRINITY_DN42020_c0_g1_i1.p1  ORF type:complete len:1248 (+),score=523.71 TRINITY_DN42020_c0_g1_i1:55-3798(+)